MRIYVDESGSFDVRPMLKRPVSCVGALVIPDEVHDDLITEYRSLRLQWIRGGREVKGRELAEADFDAVISLVSKYDVLFEVVSVDRSLTTIPEVIALKRSRANEIRLRTRRDDRLQDGRLLSELAASYEAQSINDFLQGLVTESVVWQVVQGATAYYVQRRPQELARFSWVFDAKQAGKSPIATERLWRDIIAPMVASTHSLHFLPNHDYSAFSSFSKRVPAPTTSSAQEQGGEKTVSVTDLNKVTCEDLSYVDSRSDFGVELVDVILSAFSRAVNGTLGFQGWRKLGKLVIRRPPISINVILPKLGDVPSVLIRVGYGGVMVHIHQQAKPMFTPANAYMQPSIGQLELTPGPPVILPPDAA